MKQMVCTRCGQEKSYKDFYYNHVTHKYRKFCKPCEEKDNSKPRLERKNIDSQHVEAIQRRAMLKKKFGMTLEEYNLMLEQQHGVCKICGGTKTNGVHLAVDHDHATGKVRGLLCSGCNTGLGGFRDDPRNLLKASLYLVCRNDK